MNFKNEACGIPEIKALDEYFPDYQHMVLDNKFDTIYLNSEKRSSKFIYLLHHDNHFDTILSMKAFYNKAYWCDFCKKGYNNAMNHKCRYTCKSCFRTNCPFSDQNARCHLCRENYRNLQCKAIHDERMCGKLKICSKCNHKKSHKNPHVCIDEKWCKNCSKS